MNERSKGTILVVEDDPRQIRLYAQVLERYRLVCVSTGSAAVAALAERVPDLILLDHVLAQGELGLAFLPQLKKVAAHVPIIVVSGTLDIAGQLAALQGPLSADYVIEKPVDIFKLEQTVETALNECGLGEAVRTLRSLEQAELVEDSDRERLFTERLARQHELLKRLRGAATHANVSELAGEFGVDRKTIRRDLRDLVQRGQLPAAVLPQSPDDV
ncbi:MAG TPA: response regulator [Candidatus Paceibacterota bacterium]|nr:response regulator [Candidatus Paceibacterota bacterium]HRZ57922.1 response regulator [Candidatus Paceibacterota bacterium]